MLDEKKFKRLLDASTNGHKPNQLIPYNDLVLEINKLRQLLHTTLNDLGMGDLPDEEFMELIGYYNKD